MIQSSRNGLCATVSSAMCWTVFSVVFIEFPIYVLSPLFFVQNLLTLIESEEALRSLLFYCYTFDSPAGQSSRN